MPSIQYARVRFNSGNRSSDALAATRCAIRCVLRASRRIDRSSILRKCCSLALMFDAGQRRLTLCLLAVPFGTSV
jgi:hypothetical protein